MARTQMTPNHALQRTGSAVTLADVNYRVLWGLANWGGSDDTYYGYPERVLHLGWWIIAGLITFKFILVSFLIWRRRRIARLASHDAQHAPKYDY